jgi:hypothetical protein
MTGNLRESEASAKKRCRICGTLNISKKLPRIRKSMIPGSKKKVIVDFLFGVNPTNAIVHFVPSHKLD